MQRKPHSTQIAQHIREVVKKEHPETVEHLVRLMQQKHRLSEQEIIDLMDHAGLRFTKRHARAVPTDLKHYLVTPRARWYWFVIFLCTLTATFILILPEINPVVYVRYLLGSIFVFWLPGYCLVKSLFPGKKHEKSKLIGLSWGISIVLVSMTSFTLHYTPWRIKAMSTSIALLILTLALSTLALFREHQEQYARSGV